MEKLRLTAHINDIELKNKMYKVIDKANSCLKNYDIRTTEFLNPFEIKNAKDILNSETDLKYKVDGGYQNAERQLIYIFPYYMEEDDIESNLKVIQIEGNFKFKSISHRDYLGAVIKLGVERRKIGDIIVDNDGADILIDKDVEKFLKDNLGGLTRFSKSEITCIEINELRKVEIIKEELEVIVASLRLDNVIAELARCSRNKAMDIINMERVFVNFQSETKKTKQIKAGDMITIRGKGRFFIKEILGQTRSGRTILKVEKFK